VSLRDPSKLSVKLAQELWHVAQVNVADLEANISSLCSFPRDGEPLRRVQTVENSCRSLSEANTPKRWRFSI
jgi:hypothetical protein